MKNLVLIVIFSILVIGLQAQNTVTVDTDDQNPVSIRWGNKSIEIIDGSVSIFDAQTKTHKPIRSKFNGHWAGIEIGFNNFHGENYGLYQNSNDHFLELYNAKSIEVNINPIEFNTALVGKKLGLVSGIGFTSNNFRFDNDLTIKKDENGIIRPVHLDNLQKSKLVTTYINVPLLLEVHFGKRFFVSGGVIGGINIGSRTKIVVDGEKSKERKNFNVNPYRGSLTFRAGFRNISFYTNYSLTPLFKNDKGPELYPYSIGISLVNF